MATSSYHGKYSSCTPTSERSKSTLLDSTSGSTEVVMTDPELGDTETAAAIEEDSETYMSVVYSNHKLGIAYYESGTTEIHLMPDVIEAEYGYILSKVILQVQPHCIIVHEKENEKLIQKIKSTVESVTESALDDKYIQSLPSNEFALESSKRRILSINLASIPAHFTDIERSLHLNSLVPLENISMVRALGGLLSFLHKQQGTLGLQLDNTGISVLDIKIFILEDFMSIDQQTYCALQILPKEFFSNKGKAFGYREFWQASSKKKGITLFGILNRCKSYQGSKLLRLWFLQPLKSLQKLVERQKAVAFFANPCNSLTTSTIEGKLKLMTGNIHKILAHMMRGQASVADWLNLYKSIYGAIHVAEVCKGASIQLAVFEEFGKLVTEDLYKIGNLINTIVDFEESTAEKRFVVKLNLDPKLDEKKRTYSGLPDFMTGVAREELDKLEDDVTICSVIYLPQMGYLLKIALTERQMQTGDYDIPNLEFMFIAGGYVHYKSARTKELDGMLGDIHCDITDYETSIMHRLQNTILEHTQLLLKMSHGAAELDCVLCLAACAREYNYVKPEMTTDNALKIKKGRHPLQEQVCNPFVPNDTYSGHEHSLMKILTGPNASGKSVYLKQVALIVFMAHIGSFVPAEEAKLGVLDGIFTRVKTVESVSTGLSAYQLDVNQVAVAVNNVTEHSLVILDEFGKGTKQLDGVALLCAVLQQWLQLGDKCPHTFVSTHFHDITGDEELLPRSPYLTFQTMDIIHEGSDMVFLFQLREGSTNFSYACQVAKCAGISEDTLRRGNEVSKLILAGKPIPRMDISVFESEYKLYQTIVDRFLDVDVDNDDLPSFMNDFVLPLFKGNLRP